MDIFYLLLASTFGWTIAVVLIAKRLQKLEQLLYQRKKENPTILCNQRTEIEKQQKI